METRDGFELRLPEARPVQRVEVPGEPGEFIWDLVPVPNTDVTMFEMTDDLLTDCGEVLRRWWPDATVMFSCFSDGWQDETGMPRFDGHTFDFDGNETMFPLSGSRVLLDDRLYDLVALEQQGSDYYPPQLDYGPEYPEIRILSARSLSAGTSDVILVQTWTNCTDCANPADLVLRRLLVSGDAIVEERDYIWPHEIELEAEQVVLDGEGRWVAHLQEPAPDGRMFDKVIRGELDGSETVLLDAPSIVDFETSDPSAIRIGRLFTGM
jgi:hypothetical protein